MYKCLYNCVMNQDQVGLGTQLRRLLELLDGDLEAVYAEAVPGYRPRFTPVVKALRSGPLTIKALAADAGVSHSAASQTVSRMIREGWLTHQVGDDARERMIRMTGKLRAALPALEAQWARTDAAARALEVELGAPLGAMISDAVKALEARPFRDRVRPSP